MATAILASGPKKPRSPTFVGDISHALDRRKGIKCAMNCFLEGAAWMQMIPFPGPMRSLIDQGYTLVKLAKPSCPPFKIFTKTVLQVKRTELFQLKASQIVQRGWHEIDLQNIFVIAKEFFAWGSGIISWGCRMISYVGDTALGKISRNLPEMIGKIGIATAIPSFAIAIMTQVVNCIHAVLLPKADNRLLREDQSVTLELMFYHLVAMVSKFGSLIFQGIRVFSLAPPIPIPCFMVLSTIGLIFNIIAIQREEAISRPRVYTRQSA